MMTRELLEEIAATTARIQKHACGLNLEQFTAAQLSMLAQAGLPRSLALQATGAPQTTIMEAYAGAA